MMRPHTPSQVSPALLQNAGSGWTLGSCLPEMSGGGANSTGNNPDGALHQLDIYTAAVPVP